jgi:ketosteroid isomerase-like protein
MSNIGKILETAFDHSFFVFILNHRAGLQDSIAGESELMVRWFRQRSCTTKDRHQTAEKACSDVGKPRSTSEEIMKQILLLSSLVLSLACGLAAQTKDVTETFKELQRQEDAAEVKMDLPQLERILSDGFFTPGPDGKRMTKAEYLNVFRKAPEMPEKFKEVTYSDFRVEVHGTTAISDYVATFVYTAASGKDDPHRYRLTVVWLKESGKWRMLTSCGLPF